jgi:hypothetical protein
MLEHALDRVADCNCLHGIAQQVAYHADSACMRQFNEHCEVRPVLPKDRMRRMPDALPAEDAAVSLDLRPFRIKCVAMVTEPFGAELPAPATDAALHQEPILA